MTFSGKICLMIILKIRKDQGSGFSLEDTFLTFFQIHLTHPNFLGLSSGIYLALRNMRATLSGTETVSNFADKIWPLMPDELKNTSLLQVFKNKMKNWKLTNCSQRLC